MLSDVRRHGDRIPRDAAAARALVKNIAGADLAGFDVTGVRIPFGDQTLGEGYLHGKSGLTWGIEIEDGSFHAGVPLRLPLKLASRRCSTKSGRSVDPFCGSHFMAWPSLPAMEVKVPHS